MAKVNYVSCPSCHNEYYIERMLSNALAAKPDLALKCPFCKQEFTPGEKAAAANPGPRAPAGRS